MMTELIFKGWQERHFFLGSPHDQTGFLVRFGLQSSVQVRDANSARYAEISTPKCAKAKTKSVHFSKSGRVLSHLCPRPFSSDKTPKQERMASLMPLRRSSTASGRGSGTRGRRQDLVAQIPDEENSMYSSLIPNEQKIFSFKASLQFFVKHDGVPILRVVRKDKPFPRFVVSTASGEDIYELMSGNEMDVDLSFSIRDPRSGRVIATCVKFAMKRTFDLYSGEEVNSTFLIFRMKNDPMSKATLIENKKGEVICKLRNNIVGNTVMHVASGVDLTLLFGLVLAHCEGRRQNRKSAFATLKRAAKMSPQLDTFEDQNSESDDPLPLPEEQD